jgi:methylenetetrahydrofolate--tRNA-(uracil-5-)-methyltransferase
VNTNNQRFDFVNVIGAGLAGSEAALYLAKQGIKVNLFEMKPIHKTPAHKSNFFGELVCSNSLKSTDSNTASGLLKLEMQQLGSSLLPIAQSVKVAAGGALAVDREKFSQSITEQIKNHPLINVIQTKIDQINIAEPTIIATGPLTDNVLYEHLQQLIGKQNCYFYDAIAPIIETDSIDFNHAFVGNRYGKGDTEGDYINCTLTKEQYAIFYDALINAKTVELKEFEKVFEGCMPVEVMAKRGFEALRFGPMKPVGLFDKQKNERPYAVLQLRKENEQGTLVNMVGFQTNLLYPEQKRVFSLIPALANARFVRYGQMHRNSYINAPTCLDVFSRLKQYPNIFIAGQLSGVEGYVESMASGLYCAIQMHQYLQRKMLVPLSTKTVLGAMMNYLANSITTNFQPTNANYGIMQSAHETVKNKEQKRELIKQDSLCEINKFKERIYGN